MKKALRTILLLLVFCLIQTVALAQSPRFYSMAQGLPSTRIIRLSLDTDQFLWLATERGLCRFNGLDFTSYTSNRDSQYALHENNLSCILEDRNGRHWVGAMDGFYYFCRTENKFTYHELSLIEGDRVSVSDIKLMPDDTTRLLISSYGRGLYIFDAVNSQLDTLATSRLARIIDRYTHVSRLLIDSQKRMWAVQEKGFLVCDLEQNQLLPLTGRAQILSEISTLHFNSVTEDTKHGLVYLASIEGRLFCIDEKTLQVEELPLPGKLIVMSLLPGVDDRLLIGTENEGVFSYDLQTRRVQPKHFNNCPVDLAKCKVHDMMYDQQGNLWLALFQKGLLVIPSGDPNISYNPVSASEFGANLGCVSCFTEQPGQIAVSGLDGGGIVIRNKRGQSVCLNMDNSVLESNSVMGLTSDGADGSYVATYSGGIYHLSNCADALARGVQPRLVAVEALNKFKDVYVMALEFDAQSGHLFIGTNGEGVYRFNPVKGQLSQFDVSIFNKWIMSLHVDRDRHLWVGTQNGLGFIDLNHSVIRMVPGSQSVRVFDIVECGGYRWFATDQALMTYNETLDRMEHLKRPGQHQDEEMEALACWGDSILWMTSTAGLFSYNVRSGRFQSYNCEEVWQVGNYDYGSAIEWSDGNITFGGDNGIISFAPAGMSQVASGPMPKLYFTQLWVNNVPESFSPESRDNRLDASLWHASRLTLQPDDGAFLLAFSVREYNNPRGMYYDYRLDGYDKDWQTLVGDANTLYYHHLPGGKYTLQVRAYRDESDLVNGNFAYRELRIEVLKPWYARWWMIVFYILSIATVSLVIVRHLRQRAHERRVLHRTEQKRRANEEKLRFFTSLTHEFQTPAALLLATLKKLMEHKTNNATASIYEIMHRNVMRILMLIDQQLDLRKIDNGQLHLRMQPIELQPFLIEQMQYYRDLAATMQVRFDLNMSDTGVVLWADTNELDKVVMNLVSNAFKFVNRQGEVLITTSTRSNDGLLPEVSAAEVVQIEVFNSGSRIGETEARHIFERFYKGANTDDKGSGIGLNVAYELTQLQYGTLTVHNDEKRDGVAFTITMPLGDQHLTESERYVAPAASEEQPVVQAAEELTPDPYENEQKIAKFDAEAERKLVQKYSLNIDYSQIKLESADEKLLQRVLKVINKNLGDSSFCVETLSKEVGISRVHLNRKLQEMLDISPSNLIKNIRLRQATYLLVQNNVSVSEVAYSVGYSSPSYFTSNFTQYFGMTPKDFIANYAAAPDDERLKELLYSAQNEAAGSPEVLNRETKGSSSQA